MNLEEAKRLAKRTLSKKRYTHTVNVKKMAVKLAKRYGEDPDRAAMAALLHDMAKEMPKDRMLQILQENAIMSDNAHLRPSPVWHGVCAAILARTEWNIEDEGILQAVACHTTGRPGMTRLDKILFLADMTSEDRSYPEADILRRLQMEDLDRAMIEALRMNIQWLEESEKPVDPVSREAWIDLRKTYYGGNSSYEE